MTGVCPECGKPTGLSNAFLAGLCVECDDKPQPGLTAVFVGGFLLFLVGVFVLLGVLL